MQYLYLCTLERDTSRSGEQSIFRNVIDERLDEIYQNISMVLLAKWLKNSPLTSEVAGSILSKDIALTFEKTKVQ